MWGFEKKLVSTEEFENTISLYIQRRGSVKHSHVLNSIVLSPFSCSCLSGILVFVRFPTSNRIDFF